MALKVGELYGELTLRNQQFNAGIDNSGQKMTGLGGHVSSVANSAANMFTAVVGGVTALGTAAFQVGLDYNRLQQNSRAALGVLLGSAEAANEQMDKLDTFARTSPFAKQVFITAQQQLLAFGMSAEDVIPTLDGIQQAVAAAGGSSQQLSEVTFVMAQIQAAGKITGQDLMQLGQRGINAAGLIGDALGKTGPEIRKSITEGTLSAQDALDALVTGMQNKFGGATALVKEQFTGAADRIKGAWRDIGSAISTPLIDPQGGGYLVIWANLVADGLRNAEQKARPLVDLLVDRYTPALEGVSTLLEKAGRVANAWDLSKVNGQLNTLTKYTPLIAGASSALLTMGGNNILLSKLGLSLNPVVAGMAALVLASPELREVAIQLARGLEPLLPLAGDLARVLADEATESIRDLTPELLRLVEAIAPVAVGLGTTLAGAATGVLQIVGPLADGLGKLLGWVSELPAPVLTMAAAWVLLHGVLGNVITSVSGPVASAFTNMRTTLQASKAMVEATGGQVGVLSTTAMTARVGVATLGTALKTAFISNPVGLAIMGITAAVAYFTNRQQEAEQRVDTLKGSLDELTGAYTTNTRAMVLNQLRQSDAVTYANELGISLADLVDASLDPASEAAQRLSADMDFFTQRFREGGDSSNDFGMDLEKMNAIMESVGMATDDATSAQTQWQEEMDAGAIVTDDATGALEGQNEALRTNIELQEESATSSLSLREAQLRVADGQDQVAQAIARYQEISVDANATDAEKAAAFRDIEEALLTNVGNYQAVQDAMVKNNTTGIELWNTVNAQRDAFIANAVQMGVTEEAAAALADQYGLIPDEVATNFIANTQEAENKVLTFINTYNGKSITMTIHTNGNLTPYIQYSGNANGALYNNGVKAYADGGVNATGNRVARVPQIVPGGANIVWGEPETGWEAYISGKPSMRARNAIVLADAAARLGYMILPKSATRYAEGGMAGNGPVNTPRAGDVYNLDVTISAADVAEFNNVIDFLSSVSRHAKQKAGVT